MFVAQAHSFTQQARLAITLAWVAGYTNTVTLIACGTVTSHVSGTASNLGLDVVSGKWALAAFALFLLATFLIGAMASGVCGEVARRRGWESAFVLPIALEAVLLLLFALGLEFTAAEARRNGATLFALTGVASMAMGLQNATITRISSGVVRTTHVTGVLTDLGIETVQFLLWAGELRRRPHAPGVRRSKIIEVWSHESAKRLALLASIVGSFALGAGLGALAFGSIERWAMHPPVIFLIWLIYRDIRTPIAEIQPSEMTSVESGLGLPPELGVFHVRKSARRGDSAHQMPNLLAWADRLAPTVRVVALDMGEHGEFDEGTAMELRAAVARFASEGRRLVIAGVSDEQLARLRQAGAAEFLVPANFCPDLELAIARAMVLLEHDAGR